PFFTVLAPEANDAALPFLLAADIRKQKFLPDRDVRGQSQQSAMRTHLQRRRLFVKWTFAGRMAVSENPDAERKAFAAAPFQALRSSLASEGRRGNPARAGRSSRSGLA